MDAIFDGSKSRRVGRSGSWFSPRTTNRYPRIEWVGLVGSLRVGWSQLLSRLGRRLHVVLEPKMRLVNGQMNSTLAVYIGSGREHMASLRVLCSQHMEPADDDNEIPAYRRHSTACRSPCLYSWEFRRRIDLKGHYRGLGWFVSTSASGHFVWCHDLDAYPLRCLNPGCYLDMRATSIFGADHCCGSWFVVLRLFRVHHGFGAGKDRLS